MLINSFLYFIENSVWIPINHAHNHLITFRTRAWELRVLYETKLREGTQEVKL